MTSLNHRRRGCLTAGDATFVPPVAAELLLQGVIGSRQVGIVVAVKKPRPVTARDLDEMDDSRLQIARTLLMKGHGSQQACQRPPNVAARGFLWILQDLCRFMHPTESRSHARPQRRRFGQATINQAFQPIEFFREPLFAAT